MKGQNPRQNKIGGTSPSQNPQSLGAFQNGHRRSNSRYNGNLRDSQSPSSVQKDSNATHNKLLDVLAKSLGKSAIATVSSGARYRGLLQAADPDSSPSIALSVVLHKPVLISKAVLDEKSNSDGSLPEKLVIQAKDLIDIEVNSAFKPESSCLSKEDSGAEKSSAKSTEKNIETVPENTSAISSKEEPEFVVKVSESPKLAVEPETKPETENSRATEKVAEPPVEVYRPPKRSEFRTDKDISASHQIRERELQRWVPDDDSLAVSLDDPQDHSSGAWDQFKVNEEKFGVESSYDEHLYTTKINKDVKDYQERLERAKRLAREIEGQSTTDKHVLEERGVLVDDSGMDEEDKYSGVQREQPDTRGHELMAALRSTMNASPSSKESTPRPQHGQNEQYHDDPAILSSTAARKQPLLQDGPTQEKSEQTDKEENKAALTQVARTNKEQEQSWKPSSIPPKPPKAANELLRLNAQSEINALREFSANFKVPHKMPDDLLPILAKDKMKQDEILKRQDSPKKSSPEPRKDGKFKLNPKAAAFTPSFAPPLSSQKLSNVSPNPPKANFGSPQNPSPRIHNQRPFSNASSGSSTGKRHHKITAAEFFGGQNRVPTEKSQKDKIAKFKEVFNMFNTAKKNHQDKSTPLVLEKAYQTPPTWDSTIEESYKDYIKRKSSSGNKSPVMLPPVSIPFMPSPMMAIPGASPHIAPHGFPGGTPNPKFPMSPMQGQHPGMAAQFQQQQQLQAAMMYQMQAGLPPGAHQLYYPPDPQLMPPGFMVPGAFVGSQSPVGDNVMMGSGSPYTGHANMQGHQGNFNNHHHGSRRYNNALQNKRGGNLQRSSGANQ